MNDSSVKSFTGVDLSNLFFCIFWRQSSSFLFTCFLLHHFLSSRNFGFKIKIWYSIQDTAFLLSNICVSYFLHFSNSMFHILFCSYISFPFIFLEQFRMIWIIGPEIYIKKISLELLDLYVFSSYLPTRDQKRHMFF